MTKLRSVLLAVIAAGFITEGVAQFEPPPSDRTAVTVNNAGEVVVPANFWDVNRDEIIGGLTFEDVGGTIHPDQFVSGAGSNYFLRWTGSAWEWRTGTQVRSDVGANNAGNLNTGTLPYERLGGDIPRKSDAQVIWSGSHQMDSVEASGSLFVEGNADILGSLSIGDDMQARVVGSYGAIAIEDGLGGDGGVKIDFSNTNDVRELVVPDKDGTFALLEDIPDGSDKANVDFSNVTPATGRSALELTSAATGNAAGLTSGTLPDARLSNNIPRLDGNNTFTGSNSFEQGLYVGTDGTVIIEEAGLEGLFFYNVHAGYGVGIGVSDKLTQDIWLTPPSTSGTIALTSDIPDGADKANVDFSNVTPATGRSALELTSAATGNAAGLTTGTLPGARIGTTGTNTFLRWTGSTYQWRTAADVRTDIGANNAANLTTGTLPDARLSSNVPKLDGNNTFTGSNSFTATTGMHSISFDMGTGMIMGVDGVGYIQHLDYDNIFILSGGQSKLIIDAGVGTEERTATIQGHSGTVAYLDDIPFYRDTITVQSDAERFTLTDSEVSVGTIVSVTATGMLYMVVDIDELDNNAGYSLMNPAGNVALQMRRGTQSELDSVVLAEGEPGWTVDTERLYIGTGSGNIRIGSDPADGVLQNFGYPTGFVVSGVGSISGEYTQVGTRNGLPEYLGATDEMYAYADAGGSAWYLGFNEYGDPHWISAYPANFPWEVNEWHNVWGEGTGPEFDEVIRQLDISDDTRKWVNSDIKQQRMLLNDPYVAVFQIDIPWNSAFTDFELKGSLNNFGNNEKFYYYHSPDPQYAESIYNAHPTEVYFTDSGYTDTVSTMDVQFVGGPSELAGIYPFIGYGVEIEAEHGPQLVGPIPGGNIPMYGPNAHGTLLRYDPPTLGYELFHITSGQQAMQNGPSSTDPTGTYTSSAGAMVATWRSVSQNRVAYRKQTTNQSISAMLADANSEVGGIIVVVKFDPLDPVWQDPDMRSRITWSYTLMDGSSTDNDGAGRSIWRPIRPEWVSQADVPLILTDRE